MSSEIKVGAALYEVIDPELGINIMDLGLIYEIDVDDHHHAMITMTLTTPGCPLHDSIMNGVKHRVSQIEGIEGVSVNLVCRLLLEKKKNAYHLAVELAGDWTTLHVQACGCRLQLLDRDIVRAAVCTRGT